MWCIVAELGIVGVLVGRVTNWVEVGEVEVAEVEFEVVEVVVSLNVVGGSVSPVGIVGSCIASGHESHSNSGSRKFKCDDDKLSKLTIDKTLFSDRR